MGFNSWIKKTVFLRECRWFYFTVHSIHCNGAWKQKLPTARGRTSGTRRRSWRSCDAVGYTVGVYIFQGYIFCISIIHALSPSWLTLPYPPPLHIILHNIYPWIDVLRLNVIDDSCIITFCQRSFDHACSNLLYTKGQEFLTIQYDWILPTYCVF